MPNKKELTIKKRILIEVLNEQGFSQVKISKAVKCSRRAVQYALQRLAATKSHDNRQRTGRKRLTSDQEDRILIRASIKNRKKTSSELASDFFVENNRKISPRTCRRRLQQAGLKGCKARKKPWLSEKNKIARYRWALKYRNWTPEMWANVVWSDESNFEVWFPDAYFR